MKKITILVPCYNEQESVELFYTKVMQILSGIENYKFELLFVNDGSKDDTLTIIKVLREKDENVSYLDLSRNFGKETAMIAGLITVMGMPLLSWMWICRIHQNLFR